MSNIEIKTISDFIELDKLDDNSLLKQLNFPFEENGDAILEWMDRNWLTGYINSLERQSVKRNVPFFYDAMTQRKCYFKERLLKLIEPYLRKDERFASKCPEEGEFYGYKFVTIDNNIQYIDGPYDIGIAKLKIPEDAKRVSPILGYGKCRCNHAIVEQIGKIHVIPVHYTSGKVNTITSFYNTGDPSVDMADRGYSYYKTDYEYVVGRHQIVDINLDIWDDCSRGINFFMTPPEAFRFAKSCINAC